MKYKLILTIFIFLISLMPMFGQEVLTLEKARGAAVSSSEELKKAVLSMDSAQLKKAAVKYNWLPDLSLSGSYNISFNDIENNSSASAGISLNQQIWDGGVTSVNKKIAEAGEESAVYSWEETMFDVLQQCDTYYYDFKETVSLEASARAAVEAALLLRDEAEAKYLSGVISRITYLQAKSDAASKEMLLFIAKKNRHSAEAEIASYTSLDISGFSVKTDETEDNYTAIYEAVGNIDLTDGNSINAIHPALMIHGFSNSPLIKSAYTDLKKAELEKSLDIKGYMPTFSGNAGIKSSIAGAGMFLEAPETSPISGSLGISGSISLGVWDIKNRLDQADTVIETAHLTKLQAEKNYTLNVQKSWAELISSFKATEAAEIAQEYAEEYYNAVYQRYLLSAESLSTLKDSEADRIDAETTYISSRFDLLKNLSKLLYTTAIENSETFLLLLKQNS